MAVKIFVQNEIVAGKLNGYPRVFTSSFDEKSIATVKGLYNGFDHANNSLFIIMIVILFPLTMLLRHLPVNLEGHTSPVIKVAFSNICDLGYYYLVSGSVEGQAILHHGETGDWVGTIQHEGSTLRDVAISEKASLLATCGGDGNAKLWNAIDGTEICKFQGEQPMSSVAFDSQSQYLVMGSEKKGILLHALEKPYPIIASYQGHVAGVRDVLFCSDNRTIVSSSLDRSIRFWDVESQKKICSVELPHHAKSIELCGDKETLTITYDHSVLFMNVNNHTVLRIHKMPIKLYGASLHPSKTTFVCAGSDQRIYKCDYENGFAMEHFKAHSSCIRSIKYSPDGELYASAEDSGRVRLWQQTVGKRYGLWKAEETEY